MTEWKSSRQMQGLIAPGYLWDEVTQEAVPARLLRELRLKRKAQAKRDQMPQGAIQHMIALRRNGLAWRQIAETMKRHFGFNLSPELAKDVVMGAQDWDDRFHYEVHRAKQERLRVQYQKQLIAKREEPIREKYQAAMKEKHDRQRQRLEVTGD